VPRSYDLPAYIKRASYPTVTIGLKVAQENKMTIGIEVLFSAKKNLGLLFS
jgi:hypothetical protein